MGKKGKVTEWIKKSVADGKKTVVKTETKGDTKHKHVVVHNSEPSKKKKARPSKPKRKLLRYIHENMKTPVVNWRPAMSTYFGKNVLKNVEPTLHAQLHSGSSVGTAITQNYDVDANLSNLDKMFIAKLEPGSFNTPYVAGANTVPIAGMNFAVARSQQQVHSDREFIPIGQDTYLMMAYCPALSASYTTAVGTPRMSGFFTESRTDVTGAAMYPEFFANTNTQGFNMLNLYGSDCNNFASEAFVWAGQMDISLLGPAATVSGVIYQGTLQYRQLFDGVGDMQSFSFEQMIKLATSVRKFAPDESVNVNLKSAVVNHNLIYDAPKLWSADSEAFKGEIISWAIVQSAFVAIDSGSNKNYTLSQCIRGNLAFYPKATDPLTNNLFRGNTFDEARVDHADHFTKGLSSVAHMPEARMTPALGKAITDVASSVGPDGSINGDDKDNISGSIWDGVKSVGSAIWDNKSTIAQGLALLANHPRPPVGQDGSMLYVSDLRATCSNILNCVTPYKNAAVIGDVVGDFVVTMNSYFSWLLSEPQMIPIDTVWPPIVPEVSMIKKRNQSLTSWVDVSVSNQSLR